MKVPVRYSIGSTIKCGSYFFWSAWKNVFGLCQWLEMLFHLSSLWHTDGKRRHRDPQMFLFSEFWRLAAFDLQVDKLLCRLTYWRCRLEYIHKKTGHQQICMNGINWGRTSSNFSAAECKWFNRTMYYACGNFCGVGGN